MRLPRSGSSVPSGREGVYGLRRFVLLPEAVFRLENREGAALMGVPRLCSVFDLMIRRMMERVYCARS